MSKEQPLNIAIESKSDIVMVKIPKKLGMIALATSLAIGGSFVYAARQSHMPEQKPSVQEEIARFVDDYREGVADLPDDAVVETFTIEEGGNIVKSTNYLAAKNKFSQDENNHLGESVLTSAQTVYDFNKEQGRGPSSSVEMQKGDQVEVVVGDVNDDGRRDIVVVEITH